MDGRLKERRKEEPGWFEGDAHPYFFDLLECLYGGEFHAYEPSYHFADGATSYMYVKVSRFSSNF
jgi:hypothetical protein